MSTVKASKNLALVQAILNYTKEYPFLQSAQDMIWPIIAAVKEELPEVFAYLDCRSQIKTSHITNVLNTDIRPEKLLNIDSWGNFGALKVDDLTYPTKT